MKYLVGLWTGGLMEHPDVEITELQMIEAPLRSEAERIYNEKNNCSYFYGSCVGEFNGASRKWVLYSNSISYLRGDLTPLLPFEVKPREE